MPADTHFPNRPDHIKLLLQYARLPLDNNRPCDTVDAFSNFLLSNIELVIDDYHIGGPTILSTIDKQWVKSEQFDQLTIDQKEMKLIVADVYRKKQISAPSLKWLDNYLSRLSEPPTKISSPVELQVYSGQLIERGIVKDEEGFVLFSDFDPSLKKIDVQEVDEDGSYEVEKILVSRTPFPTPLFYERPIYKLANILADALISYIRHYHLHTRECNFSECDNFFMGRGPDGNAQKYCSGACRNKAFRKNKGSD